MKKEFEEIIRTEIEALLQKKAIEISHLRKGIFLSPMFVVPKKNGKMRPVLDLRELNQYIHYQHFKMENLNTVRSLIRRNDYMTSIDLTDAYLHIPINQNQRKLFTFQWEEKLYQWTCLPFGVSAAPRIFSETLRPAILELRKRGIRVIAYHTGAGNAGRTWMVDKSGEKRTDSSTTTSILGSRDLLQGYDIQTSKGENSEHSIRDRSTPKAGDTIDSRSGTTPRPIEFCDISDPPSKTPSSPRDGGKEQSMETTPEMGGRMQTQSGSERRIGMVDGIPRRLEREIDNPAETRHNDRDRRSILRRFRRSLSWEDRPGIMGRRRSGEIQQRIGTAGHRPDLDRRTPPKGAPQDHRDRLRQHDSSGVHQPPRGKNARTQQNSRKNLEEMPRKRSPSPSTLDSRERQRSSRRGIQEEREETRLGDEGLHLPSTREGMGSTRDRSVCDSEECEGKTILLLDAGPAGEGTRCIQTTMERKLLCEPTPQSDREHPIENSKRPNSISDANSSFLARSSLVLDTSGNALGPTITTTPIPSDLPKSTPSDTNTEIPKRTFSLRMESIRKHVTTNKLSEESIEILDKRITTSSSSTYDSAWRKWLEYCGREAIDPIECEDARVINWLAKESEKRKTIGVLRSAIFETRKIAKDPKEAMAGVLRGLKRTKPAKPKYTEFWDVAKVVQYWKETGKPEEIKDLETLRMKTVLLWKLATLGRSTDLCRIIWRVKGSETTDIQFTKEGSRILTVSFRQLGGKKKEGISERIRILGIEMAEACPVRHLEEYINRVGKNWSESKPRGRKQQEFRDEEDYFKVRCGVFLSLSRQMKPIGPNSIGKITTTALRKAGVTGYSGHSSRGAGATEMLNSGKGVDEVLRLGRWSSRTVFETFYNRTAKPHDSALVLGRADLGNSDSPRSKKRAKDRREDDGIT